MRNISEWSLEGICNTTEKPDSFFPERGYSPLEALKTCRHCPVKRDCLEYALVHGEQGVWGGTTDRERRLKFPFIIIEMLRDQYIAARLLEKRTNQPILYILRAGDVISDDIEPALSDVMEA
jgi:WhiB family transcriptional regulator, redox-sensing transcriptional regulator